MTGHHRPSRWLNPRARRTPVTVIAALVLMGAVTVILRSVADADGCGRSGTRFTVATDPAVADAVAELGARWNQSRPSVNGSCVGVDVVAKPSHEMAAVLAASAGGSADMTLGSSAVPSEADLPAVWIPDSSHWLGRVQAADRNMFEPAPASIAASPIVLALPEAVAKGLQAELASGLDSTRLTRLTADPEGNNALRLAIPEPGRDTAGLVAAVMLANAIVTSDKDYPALVFAYRSIGVLNPAAGLWESFGDGVTAIPVSERALLEHNSSGTASPMTGVALTNGATLDFPYAVRTGQPRTTIAAAAAFRELLTGAAQRPELARHGLRSPDGTTESGFPAGKGANAATVPVRPLTDATPIAAAMRVWTAARTASRVLAMADVTGSTGLPLAPGGPTRLQVMQNAGLEGLRLFTDDSQVGLWSFAGDGHLPLVPLEALSQAGHRERLSATMLGTVPQPVDTAALYQSIIAGYRELLDGYRPGLSHTLVVFTDGFDTTGTDLRAVQRELEVLADVTRPIRVVLLAIGPDARLADLTDIAETTGGVAYQISTPEEMRAIFMRALLA